MQMSAIAGSEQALGAPCASCGRSMFGPGWVHVATSQLVCSDCLPNPEAEEGTAGRSVGQRIAEWLSGAHERERNAQLAEIKASGPELAESGLEIY